MKFKRNFLQQVKEMFNRNIGAREIAKYFGCSRWRIQQAYKELGIYNIGRCKPKKAYLQTERCCKICKITKSIDNFRKRIRGDRISFEVYCSLCERKYQNEKHKARAKRLRQTDPHFRIRKSISFGIWRSLKKNGSSKNSSCLKHLPYSIEELKLHLESQFETWMKWSNYGPYNRKSWKDDNISTWTWQIDHVIPQSILPYVSMEDENFKKCWALNNIRPYPAKQNIIDGTNMSRHITNINI